jgi:hypothetical protein
MIFRKSKLYFTIIQINNRFFCYNNLIIKYMQIILNIIIVYQILYIYTQ